MTRYEAPTTTLNVLSLAAVCSMHLIGPRSGLNRVSLHTQVRSELSGEIVVEDVERSADDGSGGTQVRILRLLCWLDKQQDVKPEDRRP